MTDADNVNDVKQHPKETQASPQTALIGILLIYW